VRNDGEVLKTDNCDKRCSGQWSVLIEVWQPYSTHSAPRQNIKMTPNFLTSDSRRWISCDNGIASIQRSRAMLKEAFAQFIALMLMQCPWCSWSH
jgi:uncharacterized MAPEG superfamily protein